MFSSSSLVRNISLSGSKEMNLGISKITCSSYVGGGRDYQFQKFPLPIILFRFKSGASHSNT